MHVFISYSKNDIRFARYIRQLLQAEGFKVWMDEQQLFPSQRWWQTIEKNIDTCAAFIVIMSPNSAASDWVEREILCAEHKEQRENKQIIFPVLFSGERFSRLAERQYEDMTAGESAIFSERFLLGLDNLALRNTTQLPSPSFAGVVLPNKVTAEPKAVLYKALSLFAVAQRNYLSFGLLLSILGIFVIMILFQNSQKPIPTSQFGKNWTGAFFSNNNLAGKSVLVSGIDGLNFNWGTGSPLVNGVAVPNISPSSFSARFTSTQSFQNGIYTFIASSDGGMRLYIDGTIFLDKYIDRPLTTDIRGNIKISAGMHNLTVEYGKFTEQAILQVQWVLTDIGADNTTFSTATPYVFSNISPSQEKLILEGVQTNQEWNIVVKQFNDVGMVLVPVGCFMMGNNDEKTDRHQCVQKPFWLDRYEITNGQYGSSGYFKGDDHPRDSITWVNAREFCNKSDGRLPTELEWEFAARGPDNLIYPWGNNFIPDNVTYNDNARGETSTIGRRLGGMSWVGAEDMSGNVFEWTSSMMLPYPYSSNDGREDSNDLTTDRVNRGGSWLYHADLLPSWYRRANEPNDPNKVRSDLGFRCARDFTPSDLPS